MAVLGLTFLVNFALLVIPIGVTLGILFGIDAQRSASGDAPIYTPQPSSVGGGNPDGGGGTDNKLSTVMYCQKSYGITPDTKGQEFTRTSPLSPTLPMLTKPRDHSCSSTLSFTFTSYQSFFVSRYLCLY